MLSVKPIFLANYLKFERNKLPKNVGRLFYLSWEDALWDILEKRNVKKDSVVLVPEFFCGDVENNIRNHGYKVAYYPVSNQLVTNNQQLINCIKKYHPAVLIIFHAVGITNRLFDKTDWLKYLGDGVLLIEDCVHRIIEPSQIRFIKKNHFIIDSLRKVVPLQGSVVYAQRNDINFSQPPFFQSWQYAVVVTFWWSVMNIFWLISTTVYQYTVVSMYFAKKAEQTMKIGYDLIGDSILPARGFFIFDILQQFLDFEKIKNIKERQVVFYEDNLKKLPNFIKIIPYLKADRRELIGFPLVINNKYADKFISSLRKNGLLVRAELSDSQWSKKRKIIYLPLGLHMNEDQQKNALGILT